MLLGVGDQESMELIIYLMAARQPRCAEIPRVIVGRLLEVAHAAHDPLGVGVDDEYRTAGGVEDDRIGRLGTDPPNTEQIRTQDPRRPLQIFGELGSFSKDVLRENAEFFGLLAKISRRPHKPLEPGRRGAADIRQPPQPGTPEIREGPDDIRPRGVLRQDRAERDLGAASLVQRPEEARVINRRLVSVPCDGPPSLGAVGG